MPSERGHEGEREGRSSTICSALVVRARLPPGTTMCHISTVELQALLPCSTYCRNGTAILGLVFTHDHGLPPQSSSRLSGDREPSKAARMALQVKGEVTAALKGDIWPLSGPCGAPPRRGPADCLCWSSARGRRRASPIHTP
eukprot:1509320-Rhodomonas_salina.1